MSLTRRYSQHGCLSRIVLRTLRAKHPCGSSKTFGHQFMKASFTSIILISLFCLAGCETVSSTSQFYRPLTTDVYPPKPKDYPIPILGGPPKRPFVVIGRLQFKAGHGYKYMIDAIKYNARQNGADAVVMISEDSNTQQYNYTVPGYTTTTPVTTYSSGSAYGSANYYGSNGYGHATGSAYGSGTSTTYVPTYHPGYTGVGSVTINSIDAAMLKYK